MNRRSLLLGVAIASIVLPTKAAYLPFLAPMLNALDYGVKGDGSTDDSTAINTFLTTCSTKNAIAYFPNGKTFDCKSSQIVVPDGLTVICGAATTILRSADPAGSATPYTSYTTALISIGNHVSWTGGILNNTAVLSTSTTSNTIGTGSKSFTISAGLTLTTSSFLRIWSRANPANKFEGVVSSYNSGTGALVLTASFTGGSGTFTDWNVTFGSVYQCPMVLHGVTESTISNVRVTGYWYVGMLMDGWNTSGGSSVASVSYCTFKNCWAESVQNRGFYFYGGCNDNLIDGCFIQGTSGVTDYGVNMNPANATGNTNAQLRNKIVNTTVNSAAFQGFEIGDQCSYNVIANCTVSFITDIAGVGFLVQLANALQPQYNRIIGCSANNCLGYGYQIVGANFGGIDGCSATVCGTGYQITPSGGTQCTEFSINTSEAASCTTNGFQVVGNSSRCDLNDIKAVNNGGTGVLIGAGAVRTLVTGRSFGNITANLTDGGTGSVTTGLTVA